ncbi:MAG: isocitrate lyase/phosphoenolpyruvate mutase family protein [Bryobacterales bacterium]
MNQATKLRERIRKGELLTGVGACNALEARLIEGAGFDFIWSSGFAISASYALPDASIISMTELLNATRSICDRINIPVVADCDTGFGNANNVIYAVDEFQKAGAAAISIEDKKFPKDTSLLPGGRQELVSIEEFSGKVRAAADARQGSDLVIIARTEALIAGWGVEEALSRAHHYAEAGADCILVHSKSKTPDEVVEFTKRWDGAAPLVIVPTSYPSLTGEQVRRLGKIQLMIYANQPLRAAVKAQEALLAEIKRAGGIHTIDDRMVPVSRIFDLQGVTRMKENETKYLP